MLAQTLLMTGGDPAMLGNAQTAHLLVSCHRVMSRHEIPGVKFQVAESPAPIVTGTVVIAKGARIETPVQLCYGIPRFSGEQEAKLEIVIEDDARVTVCLHYLFPEVTDAVHRMDLMIHIGEGSALTFHEGHFHGSHGWMCVNQRSMVTVKKAGKYMSRLLLVKGRVGNLTRDSMVTVGEHAFADLKVTVLGHGEDEVHLKDAVVLSGEHAHSRIQTLVVLSDHAKADITAMTEAHEQKAQGHMNYIGLIKGQGTVAISPLAKIFHPLAKVTQEAVVGGVERKELESAIACGLVPEDTVELIVKGVVR
jgi:Fe-S cluster assembly scaffold protein SufB